MPDPIDKASPAPDLPPPLVGQVWRPTVPGRALPKLVTQIGQNGCVYAIRYPTSRPYVMAACYSAKAWRAWVEKYGAEVTPETAGGRPVSRWHGRSRRSVAGA